MESNNKMLDFVLKRLEQIVQTAPNYEDDDHYSELCFLCKVIRKGTDDKELKYVIDSITPHLLLKNIYNNQCVRFVKKIENTIHRLKQRQEALDLLQEGYSGGKCVP